MQELPNDRKTNLVEQQVYQVLEEIQKSANTWFKDVYIEQTLFLCDDDLILELDYLFSVGFFWLQVAGFFGFEIKAKEYLSEKYNRYKESGHKSMILDIRYDHASDRLRTDAEIEEISNYSICLANEILEELKNESNNRPNWAQIN